MAQNTVEAKLTSSYTDRISAGVERTKAAMQSQMRQMGASLSAFASAGVDSFVKVISAARDYIRELKGAEQSSNSTLGAMKGHLLTLGLAAAGAVVGLGAYIHRLMRDASGVTELRLAYEGLAKSVNWSADTFYRLRNATDGLVQDAELLRNANKVMQAGVRLTSEQYVELAGNVNRLAKSARVDGAQALNALTESLIKGNARSLQAVGLMINVKDAISDMAAATGQKATEVENAAKAQAFYNEMLEQTRVAVARLPEDFVSYADMVGRVAKAWQDYQRDIAEAASRSGVMLELFRKLMKELNEFVKSKDDLDAITLATNRFVLALIRGAAAAIEVLELLSYAWDALWGVVKVSVNAQLAAIAALSSAGAKMLGRLMELIAMLPGEMGKAAREQVASMRRMVEASEEFARLALRDTFKAFDGVGDNAEALRKFAEWLRLTEAELQKYAKAVVTGKGGTDAFGPSADRAAADVKKLADQLKEFNSIRDQLARRYATPEMEAISRWAETLQKIEALTLISEEKKNMLRRAAYKNWVAEMVEIQRAAFDREYEAAKEQAELLSALARSMSDVTKLPPPPAMTREIRNLADDPGYREVRELELRRREEERRMQEDLRAMIDRNTPEWLKPYRDLYAEAERLNKLDLNPVQSTVRHFRDNMLDIGMKMSQGWSSFWSDLVTGQENAGKKFIASLINIVGQQLTIMAIEHTAWGIGAAALGDWVKAKRHFAAAAAFGVLGGVLTGISANLAQTRDAGAGGSFQQNVARPTSSQQVQVIQVGAPGGAQTPGAAAAAPSVQRVELSIRHEPGVIVREVSRNIKGNGELRTVIQGASA
ncbi:MAG: hypothetical protein AMXMBFR13_12390 [Phycisphaerae bacterium]